MVFIASALLLLPATAGTITQNVSSTTHSMQNCLSGLSSVTVTTKEFIAHSSLQERDISDPSYGWNKERASILISHNIPHIAHDVNLDYNATKSPTVYYRTTELKDQTAAFAWALLVVTIDFSKVSLSHMKIPQKKKQEQVCESKPKSRERSKSVLEQILSDVKRGEEISSKNMRALWSTIDEDRLDEMVSLLFLDDVLDLSLLIPNESELESIFWQITASRRVSDNDELRITVDSLQDSFNRVFGSDATPVQDMIAWGDLDMDGSVSWTEFASLLDSLHRR